MILEKNSRTCEINKLCLGVRSKSQNSAKVLHEQDFQEQTYVKAQQRVRKLQPIELVIVTKV
jgi:hypothetical protein